jgi:MFS family permease
VFPAAARVTLGVLFSGVLLGALDIAIVGPALPAIREAFTVDSRALSWVFNVYILVALVAAPFVAKLSDSQGRRTVYVTCVLLFGAGSALVALAPGFGWLLVGRAVQACGAGGLLPVASAVVADTVPVERRGRALGLIGAVFGVAFVIGPLLGGVLLPWGWQWLFLVNLPLVLIIAVVSARTLPDAPPRAPASRSASG